MQLSLLHKNLSYTFHNTNEEALLGVPFLLPYISKGQQKITILVIIVDDYITRDSDTTNI